MADPFDELTGAPRLLMEARLKPLQGRRFQPTGFADLGPARFKAYRHAGEAGSDGGNHRTVEMVLVESPQSVANRLETVCWDRAKGKLVPELDGMPYVQVFGTDQTPLTNSILEAHRLNSPYILEGDGGRFLERLKADLGGTEKGPVDVASLARTVFKYDPNAVLHGVFLTKLVGGRLRMPRLLSGFIEAEDVLDAASGGVKNDHVNPSGATERGFGNVPFHRAEFTAERLVAYFNLDLAQLHGYALGGAAETFLTALALFKIRRFLDTGLRLRTACDLDVVGGLTVTKPAAFDVPDAKTIHGLLTASLAACKKQNLFMEPAITPVVFEFEPKEKEKDKAAKGRTVKATAGGGGK